MPSRYVALFCMLLFAALMIVPAFSEDKTQVFDFNGNTDENGVPADWKLKVKNGTAEVKVVSNGDEKVMHLMCSNSSFSLERETSFDIRDFPRVEWKWKADQLPPGGDMRDKKANDQALQLLIAFEGRKILSYVWDTNAPEGTVTDESVGWPVNLKIKVVAIKSGVRDKGKWITMTRNVYDDFKKFFEEEPPKIKGVRIQSNTQYTWAISDGYFGKIVFSPAISAEATQ